MQFWEKGYGMFNTIRDVIEGVRLWKPRPSYGQAETNAHNFVAEIARKEGLAVSTDAAANTIIELPGEVDTPWVACGSHLDSVPDGGDFDGVAGVAAGLAVLLDLRSKNIIPRRTIKLFIFRGEESAWFGRSYLGSKALMGQITDYDLGAVRREGDNMITVGQAIKKCKGNASKLNIAADDRAAPLGEALGMTSYIELHIEQGPVLESLRQPIGCVTAIRGTVRYPKLQIFGESNHSGATPWRMRKDAVLAATSFIKELELFTDGTYESETDAVFTVGELFTDSKKHALTKIADEVTMSIDFRSTSEACLHTFREAVHEAMIDLQTERNIRVFPGPELIAAPAIMDPRWVRYLGDRAHKMPSGAGHDAAVVAAAGIPTGMIFVRNTGGSHNPNEKATYEDIVEGAELLKKALTTAHVVLS